MKSSASENNSLLLSGLDGSNPLAFLAALGSILLIHRVDMNARLSWQRMAGTWRPFLSTAIPTRDQLVEKLVQVLRSLPTSPFDLDAKLPFAADSLRAAMISAAHATNSHDDRREADLLAAFGTDSLRDGDDFVDTAFRMVRSGDSAGRGLPAYALEIRMCTDQDAMQRTLFYEWDYRDDFYSFRWDPVEDRQYALRWRDPSKDSKNTMLAANSLAVESLSLFPTVPTGKSLMTTGFCRIGRFEYFTWPIWEPSLSSDAIRSILTFRQLYVGAPDIDYLRSCGVAQVFRSRRFAPNKYYKNFTPATAIL